MTDYSLLIPIMAYLVVTLVLARMVAARGSNSGSFSERYFLGGQFMGGTLLALALVTTYTSASSFMGGPGAAYKFGLGWVLLAIIQVPVAMLTLGVVGPKLWRIAKQYNAVTILDVLQQRYQSRALLWLAGISLIGAFLGMVVVQFTGGARLLSVMTGVDYNVGLAMFVGTVMLYTLWGGFRAVSYTDALQGIVMVLGMLALFIGILYQGGGLTNLTSQLAQIDPALLTPKGPNEFLSWPFLMSFWILVCFGAIGLPHTAIRAMAVKDGRALKQAMVFGTAVSFVVILLPHLSGVLGRVMIPELTSPDEIIPRLMVSLFPPLVGGLLLAAPMAAIMSSVDSMLLQSASTLVRDLVMRNKPLTDKQQQRFSYASVLLLALGCGLLALDPPEMIVWLNLTAFGLLQAVFLWPVILGLFWRGATASGAICSIVCGGGSFLYWTTMKIKPLGVHAIVPALILSGISFVIASLVTKRQSVLSNG
ncbi:sodium/pantothenate symporter [Ferrimonas lipolytica]|uniref:Sodium/pantothenate symporter n=1 Tax=Ferrimonas lipolytica TaxID=2724191 RepID=A0A6H1U9Z1_9GAMM|nr:sodium/pantothenate symporter [Ferrimonas lipolytica]QIZ75861.1 sodium/pantothenate symporter [Ferrimonas lipolytica]